MEEDVDALLRIRGDAGPGFDTRVMRAKLEARLFERVANPVRIGGFEIVERIGEGGMGTVWLAHDPRLDRRVAVKLLHSTSSRGTDGLLREARALARLAHPNVVTVFETGIFEHDVFVAMEYLDAGSLAEWIAAHPATTRSEALATIDRFIAAGRGLAAAHDAGLVHRDFKPTNVLLGVDGRLKVADFGLARAVSPHSPTTEPEASRDRPERTTHDESAGGGTPAYMAPEQFEGRADARSDQFSFCVALWEALHGTRPFARASFSMREREPSHKPLPPRTSRAPSWSIRALQRGLSFDPNDRWPSMHALVAALDAAPRTARRRRAWMLAGGLGIASVIAWRPWHVEASPCVRDGDELADAWDDETRARVEQAFAANATALAPETWTRVEPLLSDYAERWLVVRDDACEASLVRQERSTEAFHATIACLDRRRDALAATTSLLATAETSAIDRAVEAVRSLPRPEDCEDPQSHGERGLVEEPELRATIAELQRSLDESEAALRLGAIENARTTLAAASTRVEMLGRADLIAQLRFLQSRIAADAYDPATAEARGLEALHEAARAGDDRLSAAIWRHLVWTIAVVRGEPRRALTLSLSASTAVVRAGDDPLLRADAHLTIGSALAEAEQVEAADAELEQAIALFRGNIDGDSPLLATAMSAQAMVRERLGRHAEALALQRETLRIFEQSLGPHHPKAAFERWRMGASLSHLGRYAEAIDPIRQGIASIEAIHGEDHDEIARALAALGPALAGVGRMDEAVATLERAVAMCDRLGPTHPGTCPYALANLSAMLDRAGRTHEAIAIADKATAAIERLPEPDGPTLAGNLANIAAMRAKLGELEPARVGFERAIAVTEASHGPAHPTLAHPLLMLARIATIEDRRDDSLAFAERAASVADVSAWPPEFVADVRFELARSRWAAGRRDAETLQIAAEAEALARKGDAEALVEQIATWRANHRAG